MQPTTTSQNPGSQRIEGLDLARSLAFIGMVIVNFKVVMVGTEPGSTSLAWFAALFEGRASATFVVLAGVGISLMSKSEGAKLLIIKRGLFLLIAGLIYTPLWPGDILHFYGAYFIMASFVLGFSNRNLLLAAAGSIFLFLGFVLAFDYEAGWDFETLTYLEQWSFPGFFRALFFNGFHPVFPWISFLFIGMWMGRLKLQDPGVIKKLFWSGLSLALAIEGLSTLMRKLSLASGQVTDLEREEVNAVLGTDLIPPMPLYMLAAAGAAVATIAASIAAAQWLGNSIILKPFIATGQMALTLYVSHVVVGMGSLLALGRLKNQTLPFSLLSTFVFFFLSIVFATLWRRRFRRGPLELLMRKVTG